MHEDDLKRLKEKLLRQRHDIFQTRQGLKKDWLELSERDIEKEEEAQKSSLTELFDQLNERELQEIEDIDLALTKMAAETYGTCENCRKVIPLSRLEAQPATRYCLPCLQKDETSRKIPPAIA